MQPSVGLDRLARRLLVSVIALHDEGPADHQFSDFSARHGSRGVAGVGDARFVMGQGDADRAELVGTVGGEGRAEAGELRHAPELDQRAGEPPFDLLHLGDRHRLPADRAAAERGEGEGVEIRVDEHVHVHGRDALEHGRLVSRDAGEDLARVEARMQDELEPVHHRPVEDDVAVDMRAGQRRDDGFERRLQMQLRGHGGVEDDGAMGLHRAFRMAGRAGRIADGRERVGPDRDRLEGLPLRDELVERRRSRHGPIAEHDGLQTGDARFEGGRDLVRAADQRLRPAIPGDVCDFGRRQHHVDRIDHGARLQRAVIADDPLPGIRRVERDAVAGPDPHLYETHSERVRQIVELAKAEGPPVDHERCPVAESAHRMGEDLSKGIEHERPSIVGGSSGAIGDRSSRRLPGLFGKLTRARWGKSSPPRNWSLFDAGAADCAELRGRRPRPPSGILRPLTSLGAKCWRRFIRPRSLGRTFMGKPAPPLRRPLALPRPGWNKDS